MRKNTLARGAALLALAALIFTFSPGGASAQEAERMGFFGEVTSVEIDAIEVLLKDGETLRIRIDTADPQIIQGAANDDPSTTASGVDLTDLFEVGSRIAALAEMREDEWWAVKISPVRAKAVEAHITVTVIHVSGTTVIAENESGDEFIIELDFEPTEELAGQVVTFVGRRLEDRRFRASAVKTVRAIVERLDGHVTEKKQKLDREGDSSPERQKLEDLKARLERSIVQQMERFAEVLVKLPTEARPALEQALENLKKGFRTALESVGKPAEEENKILNHRRLIGLVDGVDVAAGVVSVRTRSDAIVAAAVVDDTKVTIGDDEATLEDLQVGDRVDVRFGPEGNAQAIDVVTDVHAKARIEQIDREARTVTLALEGGALLTLSVPEQADLHVGDDRTEFGQVEVGTVLHVTYDSRLLVLRKAVLERRAELNVQVTSVDREAGTITGTTPDGQEHTVKLAGEAKVIVAGRRVGVTAIKVGKRVVVVVDKTDGRAVTIESHDDAPGDRAARARGIPAGIDVASGILTIELSDGGQLTVVVGDLTDVEVNGETATLEDILSDNLVQVQYDPLTGAAIEAHAKSKAEPSAFLTVRPDQANVSQDEATEGTVAGIIGGIDLIERTVTIFTESRRVLKLKVVESTNITVGGEPVGSLTDLRLASRVKASFARGREAVEIHASDETVDLAAVRDAHDRESEGAWTVAAQPLAIHLKRPEIEGGPVIVEVALKQRPVAGAIVFVNGEAVGETDDHGVVEVDLPAEGDVISFAATFKDHKTALRIKRGAAGRSASVVRLTVFDRQVDGQVLRCVTRVLGRIPANDQDATDEERQKIKAECFSDDNVGEQADRPARVIDQTILECMVRVLQRRTEGDDLNEDEKRKVNAECIERTDEGSSARLRLDLRTLECLVKVVGRRTAGNDLTEDEKRKFNAECVEGRDDANNAGRTDEGVRLDLQTLQCIVKVLGRQTLGNDLTAEEKQKVTAECIEGHDDSDGTPSPAAAPGAVDPSLSGATTTTSAATSTKP
ncbi:MAG: hypothetical protein O3A47_01940 [Chloroflexi bacterium]|nr:hypothetical protein [Chloroflexota bacterium]